MKCEIFRNGKKIMGPLEYDAQKVRDVIVRQGANGALVPKILTRMVTTATIVIKPVREVKPNLTVGQKYTGYERRESTDEVIYDYSVGNKTPDEMREKLLSRLSDTHEEYEKSRFVFKDVAIAADLEARINAKATLDLFLDGLITTAEWRGKDPSTVGIDVPLGQESTVAKIVVNNAAEMGEVYGAIVNYLGTGFAARSAVEDEVKLLTNSQLPQYDVRGRFYELANV